MSLGFPLAIRAHTTKRRPAGRRISSICLSAIGADAVSVTTALQECHPGHYAQGDQTDRRYRGDDAEKAEIAKRTSCCAHFAPPPRFRTSVIAATRLADTAGAADAQCLHAASEIPLGRCLVPIRKD